MTSSTLVSVPPKSLRTSADPHLQELVERGYTVFESAYSADEVAYFKGALTQAWRDLGEPELRSSPPSQPAEGVEIGPAGIIFHKLTQMWPEMAPRLYKPDIMATLRGLMGPEMFLELPAGVLSDASRPFFDWHVHIDGVDDAFYNNQRAYPRFERSARVTHLLYLDDMDESLGKLVVLPRKLTDPTEPPYPPTDEHWPGEVEVACPAGSVVVLEQCTWHAARRMQRPGIRSFVGSYFAAADAPPTPLADPTLADWEGDDPVFRSILPRRVSGTASP